jgi:hypothetical protein
MWALLPTWSLGNGADIRHAALLYGLQLLPVGLALASHPDRSWIKQEYIQSACVLASLMPHEKKSWTTVRLCSWSLTGVQTGGTWAFREIAAAQDTSRPTLNLKSLVSQPSGSKLEGG